METRERTIGRQGPIIAQDRHPADAIRAAAQGGARHRLYGPIVGGAATLIALGWLARIL